MPETKSKRTYDIKETAEKALKAFEQLRNEHQPGDPVGGIGTKLDVLKYEAVRKAMKQLIADGYTAKQIAQALRDGDVFNILQKSITQVLNETPPTKNPRRSKAARVKGKLPDDSTAPSAVPAKQTGRASRKTEPKNVADFTPRPDSDDI